jgi:hypothetical protein
MKKLFRSRLLWGIIILLATVSFRGVYVSTQAGLPDLSNKDPIYDKIYDRFLEFTEIN